MGACWTLYAKATSPLFDTETHWGQTTQFVFCILLLWATTAFIVPCAVDPLNTLKFIGFPLGYYWASQMSLIIFVVLLFWYASGQEKIDELFGYLPIGLDRRMTTGTKDKHESFLDNLNQIYIFYAGGFAIFVFILGMMEVGGVSEQIISVFFVVLTILVYAGIGILARTQQVDEYYVAGFKVPPIYNGMATAADWMSGASFMGLAGKVYVAGYVNLSFLMGWTGGYILVSTVIAPYLRKYKCYTVPDFLAARYKQKLGCCQLGHVARVCGVIVLFFCSFSYIVAQVYATGLIMQRFLGWDLQGGVWVGLSGILFCSMLGGMRAVTWTQVAQYIVLISAYLLPCIIMAIMRNGAFVPQLDYGGILNDIAREEKALLTAGYRDVNQVLGDGGDELYTATETKSWPRQFDFFALSCCLMFGTASLPHVLMRYFTTPSVKAARKSVAWSLFFIFLLYVSAPAYAAYAKLEILTDVVGKPIKTLPDWIYKYGNINMVQICHESTSKANLTLAKAVDVETVIRNCQKKYASDVGPTTPTPETTAAGRRELEEVNKGPLAPIVSCDPVQKAKTGNCVQITENYRLRYKDFRIENDIVVIAAPDASGQPFTIVGLVAAGGLAAALSTADGLLLAIANALSHDIFSTLIWPCISDEPPNTCIKLSVARVLLILVAALAATIASMQLADILSLVAWAFSLACGGQFPALALGVWWKGTTPLGAIAGMIAGFGVTIGYLAATKFGGMQLWGGVANISSAIFGMPVGFIVTILVSLCTPASPPEVMEMVDRLREPEKNEEDVQEDIELTTTEDKKESGTERQDDQQTIQKRHPTSNEPKPME